VEIEFDQEGKTTISMAGNLVTEQLRAKIRETEDARVRALQLHLLTASLSMAATPEDVANAVVDRVQLSFPGVAGVVMARRSRSGDSLELMQARDMPQEVFEQWRTIPLSARAPLSDSVREAKPIFLQSPADWRDHYPDLVGVLAETGHQAQMVAPLIVAGRCIGVMGVAFREPRHFSAEDRELLLSVAAQCALALERARLYEAEKEARTAAEDANRAKGDFLAAMSHELRTPLGAIAGHIDILALDLYGPTTPKQQDALQRVKRAQKHLLGIVDDLLNFARLERGRVEFIITPVRLREVIDDLTAMIAPQFTAKEIEYTVEISDEAIAVNADRGKLSQVLLNLLTNASKFTPAGGRVSLAARDRCAGGADERPMVEISVTDSGIGIPEDKLQAVFDPFVQLDTDPAHRHQGTGLGLAISRDLARGMDGELTAESNPGISTTFTLILEKAAV
jgi:signal transduction histidine kinase